MPRWVKQCGGVEVPTDTRRGPIVGRWNDARRREVARNRLIIALAQAARRNSHYATKEQTRPSITAIQTLISQKPYFHRFNTKYTRLMRFVVGIRVYSSLVS